MARIDPSTSARGTRNGSALTLVVPRRGPLTRIVGAIASRRIGAELVALTSIEQLESTGAQLNVLAARDSAAGLARAREIDAGAPAGPLAGAPTLIKDLEDWPGLPTRQGSRLLIDAPPATVSSLSPARLADAGAVVLGKSTLPEFAIEGYTSNLVTGVTRNPWDPARSTGGSSGGSAAALSAGLVAIATATDGGGSVRIPAALCGLVGLKPTTGLIGRSPEPDWIDLSTDGPLAVTTGDLALLLEVLAGPAPGDPMAPPVGVATLADWRRSADRLLLAPRLAPHQLLDPTVAAALEVAAATVSDLTGLPLTRLEVEDLALDGDPDADWYTTTASEHVHRLGRRRVEENWDLFHVATQEFFARGLACSLEEYLGARRRRFSCARALDTLLGPRGLLLAPTVTVPGWPADGTDETGAVHGLDPGKLATVLANITGLPAISIPMGMAGGLPFGLQVLAPRYHDWRLVELAARLEAIAPWPECPPGYQTLADRLGLD